MSRLSDDLNMLTSRLARRPAETCRNACCHHRQLRLKAPLG
ncbi:hypothetical protein PSNTI_13440 [Stutzerimonas stutzeri]|nr:hypothetical protein PSNTI_13440 [Stutzerimonas stutzeri]